MSDTVVLDVEMVCEGCSSAVKKILDGVDQVGKVDVDLAGQKVTVSAKAGQTLDKNALLEKLTKWGTAAGKSVKLASCCS
mmetsp:Transcript_22957/g.59916  ORF Transcript_22957/g.59916 Transcript_22957/m.59916 type:complete len:80 (+) Transcript_22957:113-352(+)